MHLFNSSESSFRKIEMAIGSMALASQMVALRIASGELVLGDPRYLDYHRQHSWTLTWVDVCVIWLSGNSTGKTNTDTLGNSVNNGYRMSFATVCFVNKKKEYAFGWETIRLRNVFRTKRKDTRGQDLSPSMQSFCCLLLAFLLISPPLSHSR